MNIPDGAQDDPRAPYNQSAEVDLENLTCPACAGKGFVVFTSDSDTEEKETCRRCYGKGIIPAHR